MSGNPIYAKDLYAGGQELAKLEAELAAIEVKIKGITTAASSMLQSLNKINSSTNSGKSAIKTAATDAEKLAAEYVKLTNAQSANAQQIKNVQAQTAKVTQEQRANAKAAASAKNSYDALSASMAQNLIKLHSLELENGKYSKSAQDLVKVIAQQREQLKQLDAQTGQYGRNVGDYLGSIKNFAFQVLGIGTAVTIVSNILSDAKKTTIEFNEALVALGNDTNITKDNLDKLGKAAIDLSGGKLGTSAKDLLSIFTLLINSNPGLADNIELLKQIAEQVDILSKSEQVNAELASGVLTTAAKQFNLSLENSAQIVDTLTAASDNGKAKLPQLADAIQNGGNVAHTAGLSLKQYLDVIEAMSSVSKDGTVESGKLAKIFSTLAKTGRDELNPSLHSIPEILRTIDKETGITTKSTTALKDITALFGSKNAELVISLISQADALEKLNGKTVEQGNALSDATKNADTLNGKTNELKETWHKFILEIDNGSGAISTFFKVATEGATGFIDSIRNNGLIKTIASFANIPLAIISLFNTVGSKQAEFDKNLKETLDAARARGIAKSITGNLNEAGDALKKFLDGLKTGTETAEPSVKEMRTQLAGLKNDLIIAKNEGDDNAVTELTSQIDALEKKLGITHKTVIDFAKGTIGYLNAEISDLNKTLQNTTSESVITTTVKQIVALEAEVKRIQKLIDDARKSLEPEKAKTALSLLASDALKSGLLGHVNKLPEPTNIFGETPEQEAARIKKSTDTGEEARKERIKGAEEEAAKLKKIADDLDAQRKANAEGNDLFGLLHISITDKEKEAIEFAYSFAKDQMTSFFDLQHQLTQQAIDDSQRRVDAAEQELNRQIDAQRNGEANTAGRAQRELNAAKKAQAEAIKLRQKQQTVELAINTALEASNLALAISKALTLGPILGPIAVGALIATFAAAKIKAFALVKKTFRTGDLEFADQAGSHESGRDQYVGHGNDGRPKYMEKGEAQAIVTTKGVNKTGRGELKSIFQAINKGEFFQKYQRIENESAGLPSITQVNVNTGRMEQSLETLVKQGAKQTYVDGAGRLVIKYKNRTTYLS